MGTSEADTASGNRGHRGGTFPHRHTTLEATHGDAANSAASTVNFTIMS